DGLGGRLDDTLGRTGLRRLHDQVAAEDGQTVVGALVAGVERAVAVLDDVADDQLLLGAQAEVLGGVRLGGVRLAYQLGALGGGELEGLGARDHLARGRRCLRRGRGGGARLDGGGDQGGEIGRAHV